MNYIYQLNTFYKFLPNNPLSSNAQCLYMFLLNYNNGLSWIKEFTVANTLICGYTNFNRQALDRARNELVQKGYIQYKKGTSNQAGKYLIVEFVTQNDTQDGHRMIHETDTERYTERAQDDTRTVPLDKLNKTKLNKTNKEKVKKEKFGEYQHVLLTEKEYQSLKSDFPHTFEELIKYLDEYIEMKGYKAKSHYLAIRKWVINAVEEHRAKVTTSTNIPQQQPTAEERAKWAEKVQQELEAKKNAKH